MPAPLASWNPARDAWETSHSHIDLFSGLSAVYSETFPSWGMTRAGVAYELPTSVPLTDDSESSSSPGMLATPTAWLGRRDSHSIGDPSRWTNPERSNELSDQIAHMLLPTPTRADGERSSLTYERGNPTLVGALLPTPTVQDSGGSRNCTQPRKPGEAPATGTTLTDWLWLREGWTGASTAQPSDDGNAA